MGGDPPAVGPREYGILVLGALSYTCYTFTWFSLPAVLSTLIEEVGLTTTEAGLLVGAIPLVYVPLGLASGLVIDRIGSRFGIGAALVVFGVAQIARGAAVDFVTLLLPTLLLGVAGTAITFGLPKLVSELFPPERTGAMSSVYQVGSSIGPAAAFGLTRPVLEPALGGWRVVFLANGGVVLAFAAVWLLASTAYARTDGWGTVRRGSDRTPDGDDRGFTMASARRDLARVFHSRDMRLLVVVGTMYLFVNHGLRGWLAVILEARGFAPDVAGATTSLLIVAGIAGTLTIPPLSDRLGRRRALLTACGGLCVAGTLGLLVATGLPAVVATLVLVGVGIGGLSPLIKVVPIELDDVGPRLTATAVGFVYAVGELGGFAGPFAVGALRDLTGSFAVGVAVLAVAALVIVLTSAAMRETA